MAGSPSNPPDRHSRRSYALFELAQPPWRARRPRTSRASCVDLSQHACHRVRDQLLREAPPGGLGLAPRRDVGRRQVRGRATDGAPGLRCDHHPRPPRLLRLGCCNAARVPGESARCATSSSSRRRASRMSTTSSCPHRPSLATRSRRRSEGASSRARSRCQPKANTPARSSAISPSCLAA